MAEVGLLNCGFPRDQETESYHGEQDGDRWKASLSLPIHGNRLNVEVEMRSSIISAGCTRLGDAKLAESHRHGNYNAGEVE